MPVKLQTCQGRVYSFSVGHLTTSPGRGDILVAHDLSRGTSHTREDQALEEGGIILMEVVIKFGIYAGPAGAMISYSAFYPRLAAWATVISSLPGLLIKEEALQTVAGSALVSPGSVRAFQFAVPATLAKSDG